MTSLPWGYPPVGLLSNLLDASGAPAALDAADAERLAAQLSQALKVTVAARSIFANEGTVFAVARREGERVLCVCARTGNRTLAQFEGDEVPAELDGETLRACLCPTTHANADAVRRELPFTRPQPVGLRKSFGFGDRLGLATPGHVRALHGTSIVPFFAQQSIREMTRSGRTPEIVSDDATWGTLEEAYLDPRGSDADHLKSTDDVDVCLAAGFTLFTIDPGAHVDDAADEEGAAALREKFDALPWGEMETTAADCRKAYPAGPVRLSGKLTIDLTEESLVRAAVKYGRAVLHTAKLHRHLASKAPTDAFELEVSVDETETPTSVVEHYYIASELKRLRVEWVSLAPRFVGRFEKGVDYIGDLGELERTFMRHAEIARRLGPYKLSLHSGSDKFSVYPIAAEYAGELIHVKTAGTSYLEALRVTATLEPALFREIFEFAVGRYDEDKKTYHVSADLAKAAAAASLSDAGLPDVLEQFDARQVLHVTYGSVLTTVDKRSRPLFRDRLLDVLKGNPEAYAVALERHLRRHVQPFA